MPPHTFCSPLLLLLLAVVAVAAANRTAAETAALVLSVVCGDANRGGTVPQSIGDLGRLDTLWLNGAGLTGTLPDSIARLTRLTYLDLTNNTLGGTIPSDIGTLASLRDLYLQGNRLSGTIPSSLTSITSLRSLDLGNNNLSGEVPSRFCSMNLCKSNEGLCAAPGIVGTIDKIENDLRRSASALPAGLSVEGALALVVYTSEEQPREESVYYRMNHALRCRSDNSNAARRDRASLTGNGSATGESSWSSWLAYAWQLTRAMRRLPVVQGEVFRGIDCTVDAGAYTVGTAVCWSGFTSTSRSRAVATDFLSGPGTLFVLRVDRGRDMGCLNQFDEEEVLLESGTAFVVDSVHPEALGRHSVLVVCMHEVAPSVCESKLVPDFHSLAGSTRQPSTCVPACGVSSVVVSTARSSETYPSEYDAGKAIRGLPHSAFAESIAGGSAESAELLSAVLWPCDDPRDADPVAAEGVAVQGHQGLSWYVYACWAREKGCVLRPDLVWVAVASEFARDAVAAPLAYRPLFTRPSGGCNQTLTTDARSDGNRVPLGRLAGLLEQRLSDRRVAELVAHSDFASAGPRLHQTAASVLAAAASPFYSYSTIDGGSEEWQRLAAMCRELADHVAACSTPRAAQFAEYCRGVASLACDIDAYAHCDMAVRANAEAAQAFFSACFWITASCGSGHPYFCRGWLSRLYFSTAGAPQALGEYCREFDSVLDFPEHVGRVTWRSAESGRMFCTCAGLLYSTLSDDAEFLLPCYGQLQAAFIQEVQQILKQLQTQSLSPDEKMIGLRKSLSPESLRYLERVHAMAPMHTSSSPRRAQTAATALACANAPTAARVEDLVSLLLAAPDFVEEPEDVIGPGSNDSDFVAPSLVRRYKDEVAVLKSKITHASTDAKEVTEQLDSARREAKGLSDRGELIRIIVEKLSDRLNQDQPVQGREERRLGKHIDERARERLVAAEAKERADAELQVVQEAVENAKAEKEALEEKLRGALEQIARYKDSAEKLRQDMVDSTQTTNTKADQIRSQSELLRARVQRANEVIEVKSASVAGLEVQLAKVRGDLGAFARQVASDVTPVIDTSVPTFRGVVTFVFCEVEESQSLWEEWPDQMITAHNIENRIIRDLLKTSGGAEVRSDGLSFFLAFGTALAAIQAAAEVIGPEGKVVYRGLRVCMGMHSGTAEVTINSTTGRPEYAGPNVNKAARIAAASKSAAILASNDSWNDFKEHTDPKRIMVLFKGKYKLKAQNIDEPIVEVLPASLKGRAVEDNSPSYVIEDSQEADDAAGFANAHNLLRTSKPQQIMQDLKNKLAQRESEVEAAHKEIAILMAESRACEQGIEDSDKEQYRLANTLNKEVSARTKLREDVGRIAKERQDTNVAFEQSGLLVKASLGRAAATQAAIQKMQGTVETWRDKFLDIKEKFDSRAELQENFDLNAQRAAVKELQDKINYLRAQMGAQTEQLTALYSELSSPPKAPEDGGRAQLLKERAAVAERHSQQLRDDLRKLEVLDASAAVKLPAVRAQSSQSTAPAAADDDECVADECRVVNVETSLAARTVMLRNEELRLAINEARASKLEAESLIRALNDQADSAASWTSDSSSSSSSSSAAAAAAMEQAQAELDREARRLAAEREECVRAIEELQRARDEELRDRRVRLRRETIDMIAAVERTRAAQRRLTCTVEKSVETGSLLGPAAASSARDSALPEELAAVAASLSQRLLQQGIKAPSVQQIMGAVSTAKSTRGRAAAGAGAGGPPSRGAALGAASRTSSKASGVVRRSPSTQGVDLRAAGIDFETLDIFGAEAGLSASLDAVKKVQSLLSEGGSLLFSDALLAGGAAAAAPDGGRWRLTPVQLKAISRMLSGFMVSNDELLAMGVPSSVVYENEKETSAVGPQGVVAGAGAQQDREGARGDKGAQGQQAHSKSQRMRMTQSRKGAKGGPTLGDVHFEVVGKSYD
eukprot:m51a1_g8203 putative leucine-rich repeat-containing protein (1951) ;mRNA; f:32454-43889